MKYFILFAGFFFSILVAADQLPAPAPAPTVTSPAAASEMDAVPMGENDIGLRMMIGSVNFPGFALDFNHRLASHWSLGASAWGMRNSVAASDGGNLDTGEYYKQYVDQRSFGAEANGTYYFRQNGARRWGPLLHGGLGWAYRQAEAVWGRYDRDPAVFTWFGDKREKESGRGGKTDWSSPYARIGADFQFALGKKSLAAGYGHLLQVGLSGMIPFDRKTVSFTKPTTGESVSIRQPALEAVFEVSYAQVF